MTLVVLQLQGWELGDKRLLNLLDLACVDRRDAGGLHWPIRGGVKHAGVCLSASCIHATKPLKPGILAPAGFGGPACGGGAADASEERGSGGEGARILWAGQQSEAAARPDSQRRPGSGPRRRLRVCGAACRTAVSLCLAACNFALITLTHQNEGPLA